MVTIDPTAIATVRTSVERVLLQGGRGLPAQPFRTAADIPAYWHACEQLHGREDLALCVAREVPVGVFGRTSYAFASAATMGDAFRVFRRDSQRVVDGLDTRLETTGQLAALSMDGPELLAPIVEVLIAILALRCQQLAEPSVQIMRVELPRRAPMDVGPWQQVFTVRPRFDAGRGVLAIPAAALARPLRTSDVAIREALGTGASTSTSEEVRTHVRAWIRDRSDLDEVARALGMSSRTLQRRLDDEGVTFRRLVLEVKIEVAKELLAHGDLTVAEVATAVGFTRVSTFSRAFLQHTGVSPSRFSATARRSSSMP